MNNREVAHLWVNQSRESARGSHFYFEGATIYSYGPHFPIARLHSRAGRRLVLFTTRTYSVTTAKHCSYVRSACSHLPIVYIPYIDPHIDPGKPEHGANLEYLQAQLKQCGRQAMRRTRESAVQADAEHAARVHRAIVDYMVFFGIRRKAPPMPGFAEAFERARRIENPDPKARDKRERARAVKAQAEYARRRLAELAREFAGPDYATMAARTNWRLHGAFMGASFMGYAIHSPVMLRLNGDAIETSQGARVPVAEAPRVWSMVRAVRERGTEFVRRGLSTARIGDYPLDRIDADGTVHAGCYVIPYSELASMARMLRLPAEG